ncbi:MAG: sigma 54-interacting transcriptional regulator [Deltaproteobacteria bacterium]|nr:sigma 54-interacting transcriptional regulator [Deltaproteobacteria bacterium]
MTTPLKLNMIFKDRIGIVADFSTLIAEKGFSITSMEVERKDDKADVYVGIEKKDRMPDRQAIFEMLGKIPGLLEIRFLEFLPQEMRENRFRVVLDNIGDGVISIDRDGRITTINKVARRVLNRDHDEMTGRDIKEFDFPDFEILECLTGKKYTNVQKILITRKGRFQYLATGRPIIDSSGTIVGAVEIDRDTREIKMLAHSISQPSRVTFGDFIGNNAVVKEAISFALKIAKTDSVVSIRGESGTGKELFAQAIHTASGRKGPFVPVNCATLPEPLLESELFGYNPGAFTGAGKEGKPGLFEIAGDGSIFLDEIGEMPLSVQAKILRVIQEKCVRRIGGSREIPINTRIITATNKNLERMVQEKQFREDLYYRINVLPIHVSPLRERIEDIPLLVEHYLFQLDSRLDKTAQSLSKDALEKLSAHDWPGNVRELKNVIERAAILCDSDRIEAGYILIGNEVGENMKGIKKPFQTAIPGDQLLQPLIHAYEKQIITDVLKKSRSIRNAAKTLGISHTALLNKIRKHSVIV